MVFMALAGVLVAVMACEEPGWALSPLGLDATRKTRAIELIGIAMGGVLLAIGAVIANRRAVAMEGTVKSTEKGLRQERLKTAIEHLGHPSDSVRLGGAYELFHLAKKEKDNEDLRQTVLDILCAHIRRATGEARLPEKACKAKPSTEIQSLLTLLFVQEHEVFEGPPHQLAGKLAERGQSFPCTTARGRPFRSISARGEPYRGIRLQKAWLVGVHLSRSGPFRDTSAKECALSGHIYKGRTFIGARLQGADLVLRHICKGRDLSRCTSARRRSLIQGVSARERAFPGRGCKGRILFRGTIARDEDFSETRLQGATSQPRRILSRRSRSAYSWEDRPREGNLSGVSVCRRIESRKDL